MLCIYIPSHETRPKLLCTNIEQYVFGFLYVEFESRVGHSSNGDDCKYCAIGNMVHCVDDVDAKVSGFRRNILVLGGVFIYMCALYATQSALAIRCRHIYEPMRY